MSAPTAPPAGRRVRPRSSTVAIGIGLLAAVAVFLIAADDRTTGDLDPRNPDPPGAQAVARVLADEGVDVTIVRSADAFDDTRVDGETTVVVTSPQQLGQSGVDRLLRHAADGRVVVVEPGPGTTDALGIADLPTRVAPDGEVAASCADPTYDGLAIEVDDAAAYAGPDGCFGTDDGALLVEPRPGLVLLGAGQLLSNDQVLRADNAAVALRLLGGTDRLVWYIPSLDDVGAGDGVSAGTLLPRWLRPAVTLTLLAAVALLLWRGRRLGPLAVEPLPVAVKAIETTRSRGRLYRKAGDRAHAAAVLRAAARTRAAEHLRVGSTTDPAALIHDVARHTGRPLDEVEALLGPTAPPPSTDSDLVTLADRLAELDREVRRP